MGLLQNPAPIDATTVIQLYSYGSVPVGGEALDGGAAGHRACVAAAALRQVSAGSGFAPPTHATKSLPRLGFGLLGLLISILEVLLESKGVIWQGQSPYSY